MSEINWSENKPENLLFLALWSRLKWSKSFLYIYIYILLLKILHLKIIWTLQFIQNHYIVAVQLRLKIQLTVKVVIHASVETFFRNRHVIYLEFGMYANWYWKVFVLKHYMFCVQITKIMLSGERHRGFINLISKSSLRNIMVSK